MMRPFFLALALAGFSSGVFAGYAQAVPPPGFTMQDGAAMYKAPPGSAANAGFYRGFTSVPGVPAKMPYAMRFAANAPSYLAKQAFKTPAMFTPAGAAFLALPLMLEWLGENYRFSDGSFEKKTKEFDTPCVASFDGYQECKQAGDGWATVWSPLPQGMCVVSVAGACRTIGRPSGTPVEVEKWNPVGPEHTPDVLPSIPPELPPLLPMPLPVAPPVINPTPGENPQPQPMLVPTGDPVPVTPPATEPGQQPAPQEFKQPWIEIKPSPTVAEPWRVTTRPVETTTTSPTAPTEPVTVPVTPGDPAAPTTTTPEKDPGLCALFPDILACKKLEEPTKEELPKRDQDITLQTGPSFSGGSCPPDVVVSVGGQQVTVLSTAQPCGWIESYMRPIILLLASISAVFIVLPRGGD